MPKITRHLGDLERQKFVELNGNAAAIRFVAGDSPSADAFSRLRVSGPNVTFSSMEPLAAKGLVWSEATSGSATIAYVANTSSHKLETTTPATLL